MLTVFDPDRLEPRGEPRRVAPSLLFDVHPEGRRFIMARPLNVARRGNRLIIVQNFFEELKPR